jgi:hypothetical protein
MFVPKPNAHIMKSEFIIAILLLNTFLLGTISCNEKPAESKVVTNNSHQVVNFDNSKELKAFRELNLDSTYVNLLDPRNTSESEYKSVMHSWSEFHQNIAEFIEQENFQWEVPDSTISIVNRIYFNKNGTIDYYGFKILNPSISAEKRNEYEIVLQKFSEHIHLDLLRDEKYAQCGKIKYVNY